MGITKPSSDLATLTEWDLQEPYFHLRTDLDAQRLAYYAADLSNAMLPDHDAHPTVFAGLAQFLADVAQQSSREAALLRFQWGLLEDCGYRPELMRDVHSGLDLPADSPAYSFDPIAGGFSGQGPTAPVTAGDHRGPGPWRVRRETLELLRRIAADPAQALAADGDSVARANRLLCVYARAIIDRELPTMPIVLEQGPRDVG